MRTAGHTALVAAILLALAPHPAGALDVTGKWRLSLGGSEQFADFVQFGTILEITAFGGTTLTGTIDPDGAFNVNVFLPLCEGGLGGRVVGETRLVGTSAALCPILSEALISAIRCECFDGNGTNGDGCDSGCQIEPCFTCAGTPSVCTPSGDGAACDDRSACTSGETCSAGVCGGGSPVSPCIDLSGQWLEHMSVPALGIEEDAIVDVAQVGTILELGGSPASLPLTFGTIDPATGAVKQAAGVGVFFCPGATVFDGTAAPDGSTYALSGLRYALDLDECKSYAATVTGTRCVGPCVLPTSTTSTTTSTSTTTTTAPQLLSGKRLVLKAHADPARRRLTLDSTDAGLSIGGANGSPDDPTVAGATLRVLTAAACGDACDATYALPAEGWRFLGEPGENKGYRYVDRRLAGGPVKRVTVRHGRALKVVATGAQLEHQLVEDPEPVDVVLKVGDRQSCLRFGGTTRFRPGRTFRASSAPAPGMCPPL